MMQRNDMVALVAGAIVGMGGGALGAFLVCTVGRAVVRRFLDPYPDLGQPAPPMERHGPRRASVGGASVTQLASDHSPRHAPIL